MISPSHRPRSFFSPLRLLPVLVTLCVLVPGLVLAATSKAEQAGQPQDPFTTVVDKAMRWSQRSYKEGEGIVPEAFRQLSEGQWNGIQLKADQAPWAGQYLPFGLEPYHSGFIYARSVHINIVDENGVTPLEYSPDMYAFAAKPLAERAGQTPPGFAGFRLTYPLSDPNRMEGVVSFLGATYFQGVGKYSRPGINARGLALNTANANGEEVPYFREFWIVKPKDGDRSMVVLAMLDSPSLTGAYRFTVTPGTSTVMDVECRLFLRKGAPWPGKIGIAPLTSMFLFSESGYGGPSEYRPEVHNSDGLLMSTGENEWSWSPLVNPARLALNTFPMENPRGFGLMQRDDNFDHYQDIEARFDLRPSVWVEPQGDWGSGRVELIEIPSSKEIHDNIVAFWVPDAVEDEGDENSGVLSMAYRLYWMRPGVTPHALGRVTATRVVKNGKSDATRFIIDFESETLKALPADTGLTSVVEAPENAPISDKQLTKNPATGGWRLSFTVRIPRQEGVVQTIISAREGSPRLRFKALLKRGENLPDPLTEVWVYDLAS